MERSKTRVSVETVEAEDVLRAPQISKRLGTIISIEYLFAHELREDERSPLAIECSLNAIFSRNSPMSLSYRSSTSFSNSIL